MNAIYGLAQEQVEQNEIPGSRVRNLSLQACLESLRTSRLAFPVYILAYRYRDKLYRAVVHGQDDSVIVGDTPLSWLKIIALILGLSFVGAMLLYFANQ